MVIATLPEPLTTSDLREFADHVVAVPFSEHYIAHWWNTGLDYIQDEARLQHEVLVLSSDYVGKPYSVAMLGVFLRQSGLTMVGPNPWSDQTVVFGAKDQRGCMSRVPGGCWMMAGESGLRVDPSFRWWYSDDDIEMQARHRTGTGILPGTGLVAEGDTPLSEEKQRWAVEDRKKFVEKWGCEPW